MLIHWVWLATRPGMSDREKVMLLQHFRDAEDVYFADGSSYAGLPTNAVTALQDKNLHTAEEILAECDRKKIRILCYQDAAYPARLKNIADPPLILYYKGTLPEFDRLPLIGVVGTRKASGYGLTVAKRMGYQIASCGGIVVSGAAYGIDGMAMRGALMAGSPVIGVLGNGADIVYPAPNRSLFADTERNGCLLTEFPPGTPPHKWNFPKRNRIISGLSCGVLVVEAPEGSGALHTARAASDQGREVFVVPGNIDTPTCKASNALLRDGAIAVSDGWDVLSEYAARFPDRLKKQLSGQQLQVGSEELRQLSEESTDADLKVAQKPQRPACRKTQNQANEKKEVDNSKSSQYIDAEEKKPQLTADEQAIYALICQGTTQVDDLIAQVSCPAGIVLSALTLLEMKGLVTRRPGKRVERK